MQYARFPELLTAHRGDGGGEAIGRATVDAIAQAAPDEPLRGRASACE